MFAFRRLGGGLGPGQRQQSQLCCLNFESLAGGGGASVSDSDRHRRFANVVLSWVDGHPSPSAEGFPVGDISAKYYCEIFLVYPQFCPQFCI